MHIVIYDNRNELTLEQESDLIGSIGVLLEQELNIDDYLIWIE